MGVPSPELAGIRAKLERADEHLGRLNELVASFRESHPPEISTEFDPVASQHTLRVNAFNGPIPSAIPVIVGEIVFQLRSCLDHLVCQLFTPGGTEDEYAGLAFPVIWDKTLTEETVSKGVANDIKRSAAPRSRRCLLAAAHTEIKALQPYYSPGDPKNHPLWVLNNLHRTDKHRLLILVARAFRPQKVRIFHSEGKPLRDVLFDFASRVTALEDGAVVGKAIGGPLEMKMEIDAVTDVAFSKVGNVKDQPIVPSLQQLREIVVAVIDDFEAKFF